MNKFTPLVSVIMSAKNSEQTVSQAVKSIQAQTYENIEILILDDASTDNTFEILSELADSDRRIKLYKNQKNIGLTKSLNKLISFANGSYIARQDSDDYSEKNRIELQIQHIELQNLDASTTRAKILNSNRKIPGLSYYIPYKLSMRYKNPFIHGTLIISKKIINNLGNYDENFYFAQDYKLMKDFLNAGYKVRSLSKTLYYLNTKNNISQNNKDEQNYYFECARKNLKPKIN